MAEPLLRVTDLRKEFLTGGGLLRKPRRLVALDGVSLDVARGEVLGIVGESGCGKSTLGRLILALDRPTSGEVILDGSDLNALSKGQLRQLRRRMAMVFQDPYASLDPRFTLSEALAEPFRAQGEAPPKGRIASLMDQVGLSARLAGSYPHQLSGGQRQRVGIARALAQSPDLIVLDEPTASLDVSIQAQIVALLADLRREMGLTYVFISHDLGLVRYFCDRVVVMYLGRLAEILPSPDTPPRHPYSRALMASAFTPDPRARRALSPIEGDIPSGFDLPKGCAFVARCPRALPACREAPPPLAGEGLAIACFNPFPKD